MIFCCDDYEKKLQRLLNEFGSVCKKRKLTVNVEKSKVMRVSKAGDWNELNISLDGRRMEEVDVYRYLGVDVTNDRKKNEEVNHRIGKAKKVSGGLQKLWKRRCVTREAKVGIYEGIAMPSLLHGYEVWGFNVHERKCIEAVEMNCLRNVCGVRRIDRVRNEEIKRRCRKKARVSERMDQSVLR